MEQNEKGKSYLSQKWYVAHTPPAVNEENCDQIQFLSSIKKVCPSLLKVLAVTDRFIFAISLLVKYLFTFLTHSVLGFSLKHNK